MIMSAAGSVGSIKESYFKFSKRQAKKDNTQHTLPRPNTLCRLLPLFLPMLHPERIQQMPRTIDEASKYCGGPRIVTPLSSYSLIGSVVCICLYLAQQCSAQGSQPIQLYGVNYGVRKGIDWDPDWLRCKTEEEILADLNLLRRITSRIRILSLVDCHQGELVLKLAQTLGFQIFLGLWVGPDPGVVQNEINELKRLIQSQPSQFSPSTNYVLGVSVGSEALYRKDVTLEDIIDYKDEVKSALVDANLSEVPVTIVDISNTYVGLPTLREEVDVIMMNNFPFWEPGLIQNPDLAPSFMADTRLAPITSWAEQNNKEWILGETGWSAGGFDKGSNVASPENQLSFFQAFFCLASDRGWSYFWFTGFDNDWRVAQSIAEGEDGNTVEGQFGLFYSNRTLKEHFQSLDFSCPFPASGVRYYFDVNSTLPTTQAPASTSTEFPSSAPTSSTEFPSSAPTSSTAQPTAAVTVAPTEAPTEKPTTAMPSHVPTMTPTEGDTLPPSMVPTLIPDSTSTPNDTLNPTNQPTIRKTVSPTLPPSPSSESNNTPGNLISASFRTQPWGGTSIVGIWGIVFGFSIVLFNFVV